MQEIIESQTPFFPLVPPLPAVYFRQLFKNISGESDPAINRTKLCGIKKWWPKGNFKVVPTDVLLRNFQSWMTVFFLGCPELSKELPGADWAGGGIQTPPCFNHPNLQLCDPETHTVRCVPTYRGHSGPVVMCFRAASSPGSAVPRRPWVCHFCGPQFPPL